MISFVLSRGKPLPRMQLVTAWVRPVGRKRPQRAMQGLGAPPAQPIPSPLRRGFLCVLMCGIGESKSRVAKDCSSLYSSNPKHSRPHLVRPGRTPVSSILGCLTSSVIVKRKQRPKTLFSFDVRDRRIELLPSVWKTDVLPLN